VVHRQIIRERTICLAERAQARGYHPWDAVHSHEKLLQAKEVPIIEIGEAVRLCLSDKEAEGVREGLFSST